MFAMWGIAIGGPVMYSFRMQSMTNPHTTGESLTVKVVEAVAEYEGTEMLALPPLASTINPDALDALFDSIEDPRDTETRLTLSYCGHTVHIAPDHTITITD